MAGDAGEGEDEGEEEAEAAYFSLGLDIFSGDELAVELAVDVSPQTVLTPLAFPIEAPLVVFLLDPKRRFANSILCQKSAICCSPKWRSVFSDHYYTFSHSHVSDY